MCEFTEENRDGGITVNSLKDNIENLDRSNIHLYLQGDNIVDLGENITTDKYLAKVEKANIKSVQLLGDAGRGINEKVDNDGINEKFNITFKIKKKELV